MNERAKLIYQAALDGKTVQNKAWENKDGEQIWEDECPFRHTLNPIDFPLDWRIKPEKRSELRHLRVYLDEEENSAAIYHLSSGRETKRLENMDYFGGWITSWIPYRVEVEE